LEKRNKFWQTIGNTEGVEIPATLLSELEMQEFAKPTAVPYPEAVPLTSPTVPESTLEYVRNRGFDPVDLNDNWGVWYSRDEDLLGGYDHLVFPVFYNKKLMGWQARLVEDAPRPKYYIPKGMDKAKLLFNSDRARLYQDVIVCEGVFDTIRVGYNAVCTFGKKPSNRQLRLLRDYWPNGEVILLYDPDTAEESSLLAARYTSAGFFKKGCRYIKLPEGKDPADMNRKQLIELIAGEYVN
jgi:hypothetical protein